MPNRQIRPVTIRSAQWSLPLLALALCLQFAACGGNSSSPGGGGNGVTTTSLPDGKVGTTYQAQLQASGGTPPYTWTLTGGKLPPGLSLGPGGIISGNPTQAGVFGSLVFTATDSAGHSANSSALSIMIAASVQVTTTSLPNAMVGSAYSTTLQATGGTAPYTWAVTPGILGTIPPGITLNSNGTLTGTPTEPGLFGSLGFTVTDAKGLTANSVALSINVIPLPLVITTTSLPNAIIGQPYSFFLSRTGGNPPFNWTVKSGSLPPGLALNPSSGGINGTPTAPGVNPLVFEVTDSDKTVATSGNLSLQFTLTVATNSLPGGMVNAPYSATLQATGGTPPYTWSGPQGGWPSLLPLNLNASTGTITGTPTTPGAFGALVFTVQDSTGATAMSHNLLINIAALPLIITTTSLPEGFLQNVYANPDGSPVGLTYTGGNPPIVFSIKSGSLPGGLTIPGPCFCSIQGTPNANDPQTTYNFVLQATDSVGTVATAPLSIQIGSIFTLTTTSLPNGTIGSPYSTMLMANYGTPPYFFKFQPGTPIGTLPPNVYLDPLGSGTISGTPLANGQGEILYFQVTDSSMPPATALGQVPQIVLAPQLFITTTSLPNGVPGVPYSATLQGKGGTPPYTWSISSGSLPPPLGLNAATGVISGTPTTNGTYPVVFTLTDSTHAFVNSSQLSITIATPPPLAILNVSLPGTNSGGTEPYNATLVAANGTPPYTWSSPDPLDLPPGLSLNASGVISGMATGPGGQFTVQVTDSKSGTASSNFTIAVTPPACPSGAEIKLGTQPYAFLLKGFVASGVDKGPIAIAGSFTPNGSGGITGGEEDVNNSAMNPGKNAIPLDTTHSSYTLFQGASGENPRGCLTLATSATSSSTFRFVLSENDGNGHWLTGRIIEFDDKDGTGTLASGIMRRQDTSTFAQGPNGTYAFQFTGTDKNGSRFALAGSLNAISQGITNVVADSDLGGTVNSDVTGGSGTYLNPDFVFGRGTGSLIIGSSVFDLPFTYYQVNASEIIFISADKLANNPIFGGEALTSNGPFMADQLSEHFLYHMAGTSSSGSAATIGTLVFLSNNLWIGDYWQDAAGVSTSDIPINGSYTVDAASGRVLFSGNFGAGSAPVGYMIAPTTGTTTPSVYLVGTDPAATSGLVEFQGNTGTITGPSGFFALGSDEAPDNATNNQTGQIDITPGSGGAFTYMGTGDDSDAGPGGLAANQPIANSGTFATNGTGDFGPSTAAVTNGTVTYYINEDPAITHPVVVGVQP